jgi:phage-related protein
VDGDKPLVWIGRSKEDISAFPDDVNLLMGFALRTAQSGGKHPRAKSLTGFGGGGVLEIVDDYDGDTYRAVYTVSFSGVVYALHAFQKKSKTGKKTPQLDILRVKARLKLAARDFEKRQSAEKANGKK